MTVRRRERGMTLVEMLVAVTVLLILSAILSEVFLQASQASARGKALAEICQAARSLRTVMAKDLEGATADCFVGGENGLALGPVSYLPPGPYNVTQYPPINSIDALDRMLMGGSDYLAFTSSNAASGDKPLAKVFYVLRASGELVRVVYPWQVNQDYTTLDYSNGEDQTDINVYHHNMNTLEGTQVMAQNVLRLKFSYLDQGSGGALSTGGMKYAGGLWVDMWDWKVKNYMPAAVKVQLQIVDHQWTLGGDNAVVNKAFNPEKLDSPSYAEAGELSDPNNGEAFSFIVNLPQGTRGPGM